MAIKTIAIAPAPLSESGDDIYAVDIRGVADTIAATELTEENTFELTIDSTVDYVIKRNESAKAFTADAGTDVITSTAHGLLNGETTYVKGTSLPGGLSQKTVYFVRDVTANTLKLAATALGAAIDLTTAGSGTMTLVAPPFRSSLDTVVGYVYGDGEVMVGEGEVDGYTQDQALRLILSAVCGKVVATSTSFVARSADDSKDRITATTTADGDRTVVTLDAS